MDNLDNIVRKVTFLIRIALLGCILLSIGVLVIAIAMAEKINPDNHFVEFIFFLTFYSFIWLTIPSLFLLIAIALDSKYRKKKKTQAIKTEVKLLIFNFIIIFIAVTVIKLF